MINTDTLDTLCDICGKPILFKQLVSVSVMDYTYDFPKLIMKNYHKECFVCKFVELMSD